MSKASMRASQHPGLQRQFSWVFACVSWFPAFLYAQPAPVQVTTNIPLAVQLPQHVPMKAGHPLACRLQYPVYVDGQLAIPAGSTVLGSIVRLDADPSRRVRARFHGDFTPFRVPVVQFNQMVLADGSLQAMVSVPATHGVPVLHLSPPPGRRPSGFFGQQWYAAKEQVKKTAAVFTAPGRGDRLVQFMYSQLPYHPQRVESGATWTVELAQPLDLKLSPSVPKVAVVARPAEHGDQWQLHAYLQATISSAKEKPGDRFQAWIAEPVFTADHVLVVPEGSLLVGEITQAKAARSFGRQGRLRFKFREIQLPGGVSQPVKADLTGIDSDRAANLEVDSEGAVEPKPQNRVLTPLVLALLASRGFDQDDNQYVNGAVAANGFGIVGRLAGIVASSRNVAVGIGIYGAALSLYDLWLARGKDVVFSRNTRIEVTTTPARSALTP